MLVCKVRACLLQMACFKCCGVVSWLTLFIWDFACKAWLRVGRALCRTALVSCSKWCLSFANKQNPRAMPGSSHHFACSYGVARVYSRWKRNLGSCICGAFEAVKCCLCCCCWYKLSVAGYKKKQVRHCIKKNKKTKELALFFHSCAFVTFLLVTRLLQKCVIRIIGTLGHFPSYHVINFV